VNYLKAFRGSFLQDFYSIEKLNKLAKELKYPKDSNYICTERVKNRQIIIDGVHRASILAARDMKDVMIAEVL
jgi:hypothetical protein